MLSTIPGRKEKYALAIEKIEAVRHNVTVKECLDRTLDSKTTEDGIKKMLTLSTTADDDDIVMGPSDLNMGLKETALFCQRYARWKRSWLLSVFSVHGPGRQTLTTWSGVLQFLTLYLARRGSSPQSASKEVPTAGVCCAGHIKS